MDAPETASTERELIAHAFLREAVFRSRASQAATAVIVRSESERKLAAGQCGLGEKAAIVLDLAEPGRALFDQLWPAGLADDALDAVHVVTRAWIVEQDAIDRRRNHHLKAFRQKHGFDRRAYTPELTAEFEAGLERINREEDAGRIAAAQALLAAS